MCWRATYNDVGKLTGFEYDLLSFYNLDYFHADSCAMSPLAFLLNFGSFVTPFGLKLLHNIAAITIVLH